MKLIIDIPYESYYTFKCDLGKGNLNALAEIVAHGTPYNPSGDAISRELLKKDIDAQISDFNELNKKGEPYKEFKDIRAILFGLFIGKNLIDNAPTVPLPNEQTAWEQGYEAGLAQGKQDRPQGEYIRVDTLWAKCSICGNLTRVIKKYNMPNFCPACGADMRKDGAE